MSRADRKDLPPPSHAIEGVDESPRAPAPEPPPPAHVMRSIVDALPDGGTLHLRDHCRWWSWAVLDADGVRTARGEAPTEAEAREAASAPPVDPAITLRALSTQPPEESP